jgi:hypothetical protein
LFKKQLKESMMTMMIATILLVSSLAAHAHNDVPDRHYHVFEEKDWFRGHLDDTVCHSPCCYAVTIQLNKNITYDTANKPCSQSLQYA